MSSIKTPDQRIRVFVSSTLQELAPERKTAKEAITRLRLIPVLFELGARPHPPRELYRAYLDQSHIFVGIYWNSYGWVAPDMTISGLEDEFLLSEGKVRLIYIKDSNERQPETERLLNDIQRANALTYQRFSTAEEFKELLENDLAILLSERFEAGPETRSGQARENEVRTYLPLVRSKLIGREKELQSLQEQLFLPDTGLLTLTGAGGTGKSRLAIELGHRVKDRFRHGVVFVSLASVTDPALVVPAIAHALGLIDTGHQPIQDTLIEYLHDKNMLLILDNFERLLVAGSFISMLLRRCHRLKVVVTSRAALHVRDERLFPVLPLSVSFPEHDESGKDIQAHPAVQLFIERALDVNPFMPVDDAALRAIREICAKVDGLPLAIELAAARTKLLSPQALLNRMDKTLDVLSQGHRDLPERHQTIRATMEWSYNMLDERASLFFRHLSVFNDGWTLESSEALMKKSGLDIDVLDYTDKLLNAGLIHPLASSARNATEPRFGMLLTVREYASEKLTGSGETEKARRDHALYFADLLELVQPRLWYDDPLPWLNRLDAEHRNISDAFYYFMEISDRNRAWGIIGLLEYYWNSKGRFSEAFSWVDMAGIDPEAEIDESEISTVNQANAFLALGSLSFLAGRFADAMRCDEKSALMFQKAGITDGVARAKTYLGTVSLSLGRGEEAMTYFQEAIRISSGKDIFSFVMSSAFMGVIFISMRDFEKADYYIARAEEHARKSPQGILLAITLLEKATGCYIREDYPGALQFCRESVDIFDASGFQGMKGWAQHVLGQSYQMTGDPANARKYYAEGIESGRTSGDKAMVLFGLIGMGAIAFENAQPEKAARLLGAAEMLMRLTGYAFWSTDKILYEWLVDKLSTHLQPEDLSRLRNEGEKMSPENAIALAMA